MAISVQLKPREVRQARRLAKERDKPKKDIDESRVEGWGHDSEDRHYFAVLSEWAFAKHHDLKIDSQTYPRSDQGRDFRVRIDSEEFDSETVDIDVKSSPVNDPKLMVQTDKVDADYYVLCRFPDGVPEGGSEGIVELVGGASREMLLRQEPRWSESYEHYNYEIQPKFLRELPSPDAIEPVEEKHR